MTAGRYEGALAVKAVPFPASIDLDSWELGYADGQFGTRFRTRVGVGRAVYVGTGKKQSARRRASSARTL